MKVSHHTNRGLCFGKGLEEIYFSYPRKNPETAGVNCDSHHQLQPALCSGRPVSAMKNGEGNKYRGLLSGSFPEMISI